MKLITKYKRLCFGQTDLFSADINAIDNQIDTKISGLKEKNNIQEITENKKDINTYTTKKSKIAGELSESGTYIKELIQEREQYENKLKENSEYVKAPISGVVSYRVDNLEEVLTPNSFDELNKEMLNKLDVKTGQIVSTSSEMGKVINNYECYICAIVKSKEAKEAKIGNKVLLKLSTQEEIKATIEYLKVEDDESVLIVLKTSDAVEELINYRKISFDIIWWKYDGLKTPKSAIIYDNGLSYVVRNRAGYHSKILIKILKESDKYCIITNYDYEELKNMGYSSAEINNMKEISIYDEVLINPKVEDLKQGNITKMLHKD